MIPYEQLAQALERYRNRQAALVAEEPEPIASLDNELDAADHLEHTEISGVGLQSLGVAPNDEKSTQLEVDDILSDEERS